MLTPPIQGDLPRKRLDPRRVLDSGECGLFDLQPVELIEGEILLK